MEEACTKDNTIGVFLASMIPYAPRYATKSWFRINAVILAWTLVSLVEILLTLEPENRLTGTRSYLIYNTTVCFIWTVECGLHLLEYQHRKHFSHIRLAVSERPNTTKENDNDEDDEYNDDDKCEIYLIIIELMLAGYYLYDAVVTFSVLWMYPNFNIGTELFDVLLDMVAYTYLTVRLSSYSESSIKKENNNHEATKSIPAGGDATDYVGMKDRGDETGV